MSGELFGDRAHLTQRLPIYPKVRRMLRLRNLAIFPAIAIAGLSMTATPRAVASAAELTCHGKPVTITGSYELTGTAGDDVILGVGESLVSAGAGDDTICLVGGGSDTSVAAGSGHDLVDASQATTTLIDAELDDGADTYIGSPGSDHVLDIEPGDACGRHHRHRGRRRPGGPQRR